MFGVGALGASLASVVLTHATSAALFGALAAVAAAGACCVAALRRL